VGSSPTPGTNERSEFGTRGESQLLGFRWDEKAAAMRELSLKATSERREERAARNFRQEIYL